MIGPPELQNVLQKGSHHHSFEMNWRFCKELMNRGELPLSEPVDDDLDYPGVIAFAGKAFRISNIMSVTAPPWEASLF